MLTIQNGKASLWAFFLSEMTSLCSWVMKSEMACVIIHHFSQVIQNGGFQQALWKRLCLCKTATWLACIENIQRFPFLLLLRSNAGMVMSDLEADVLNELGSSKDLKTVVGVKAASYSIIRTWHCEFKTKKTENNTDKPNGRPKSVSNESNVAV